MCQCARTIRTPSGLFRGGNGQRLTPPSQRPVAARSRFVESCDPTNINTVCGETPSEIENHRCYSLHGCRSWRARSMRCRSFTARCRRPPRDPFTLFVWEVLSVHSTPRKRDAALAASEAYSRADAGRDVARAAEEARRERGACRTLSRKPPDGAQDRRRSLPALAGAAGASRRPARSGATGAQAVSAARRGRRPPAAALRRGPSRSCRSTHGSTASAAVWGTDRRPPISRSRRGRSRPR